MCLFPIRAWLGFNPDTGASQLFFRFVDGCEEISLPCGHCVECAVSYSNEWAVRCMLEASLYTHNCMITLTYANSPGSLVKRDLQLFIKRLREHLSPLRIRYFAAGEYGKKGLRPHYHIIVFGWRPDDCVFFFNRDGHSVYKSDFVARIWGLGFITVEDVTFASAKYCAKYLQKLSPLPEGLSLPFTCMSLKPGIGLNGFKSSWMLSGGCYLSGKFYPIPRYIRRKLQGDFTEVDLLRKKRSKLMASTLESRRLRAFMRYGKLR